MKCYNEQFDGMKQLINDINNVYDQPCDFYGVDPYVQEEYNLYPNLDFPNRYCIYNSNIVEFWKPITENEVPGIENYRYWISSWGNTWDYKLRKPMPIVCSKGNKYYEQANISINGKRVTLKIHRMVMMLFNPIPNPENYQINHIDCSHNVNNTYNLEWCDDSYNRLHSIINGVGTNIFHDQIRIFTPEQIHQMYVLKEEKGYNYRQIYNEMHLESYGDYELARKAIERISHGTSKLYSRYYF